MFKTLIAAAALATAVASTAIAAPPNAPAPGDSAFGSDMSVVHQMLADHAKINRSVTNLPDGIRTVTESDDPRVANEIKDHVARMEQRLKDGKVFNVASRSLPTIFANNAKIHTEIEQTAKGVILTQTSTDPATVAALQAHAGEVSDLAQQGMVALMRSMMANGGSMGMGMMHEMMHGGAPAQTTP
jgi:predicted component of type VI protein secretion system